MTKSHFVKSARKDNQVAKKGQPYYWWKFRYGGKHYSLTAPKASQLINSPFLSQVASMQEEMESWTPETADDLRDLIEDMVSQINDMASEEQDKLSNMPDGLQQGSTGELLQSRSDELENWASELEGITVDDEETEKEEGETDEDLKERNAESLANALSEAQGTCYNGE